MSSSAAVIHSFLSYPRICEQKMPHFFLFRDLTFNNFCDTGSDGWFWPSLIMAVMVLTKTLAGRFARGVVRCCQRIEEAVAIIVLIRGHHGPDLYISLDLLQS